MRLWTIGSINVYSLNPLVLIFFFSILINLSTSNFHVLDFLSFGSDVIVRS